MKPVEGMPGLARTNSGAIVAKDTASYREALWKKTIGRRIEALEKELTAVKQELAELKEKNGAGSDS